jgi:hypothetical protein
MMAALNVQAALTVARGGDAVMSIVAAAVLVLVIAGLAHATEARAVSAEHRTGLCDGLRATHTLDPSQTIIVYAAMAGRFGVIQVVARDAGVQLDVQGIERGTDGHGHRSHSFTPMSWSEAIRPRELLDEAIASMQSTPTLSPPHRGNSKSASRYQICHDVSPPARLRNLCFLRWHRRASDLPRQ